MTYIAQVKNLNNDIILFWPSCSATKEEVTERWQKIKEMFELSDDRFIGIVKINVRYVDPTEKINEDYVRSNHYIFGTEIFDEHKPPRFDPFKIVCITLAETNSVWADYALKYDGEVSRNNRILIAEIINE